MNYHDTALAGACDPMGFFTVTKSTPKVRGLLVALTDPSQPELLADFLRWYEEVQIPAFLKEVRGTLRGIRYRASPVVVEPSLQAQQEYLALYDLGFDHADELPDYVRRQIAAKDGNRVGFGSPGGSSLNTRTSKGAYYLPLTPQSGVQDFVPDTVVLLFLDVQAEPSGSALVPWLSGAFTQGILLLPGVRAVTSFRQADLRGMQVNAHLLDWVTPSTVLARVELDIHEHGALRDTLRLLEASMPSWPHWIDRRTVSMRAYERIGAAQGSL